jgi:endonuclease YncB( thermonuclease family)
MDLFIGYLMDVARWVVILILTAVYPESYQAWRGVVVEIVRPDEFKVDRLGHPVNVRLYGVDSPLVIRGQPFGKIARAYAERRLVGRVVKVQPVPGLIKGPWYRPKILPYDDLHWDDNVRNRYIRLMALVYLDGESLSEEYLKKGMAWWYRPFVPFERGYKYLEDQAREAKAGLWTLRDPRPPWEYQHTPISEVNPWQKKRGELLAFSGAGIAMALLILVVVWLVVRSRARGRKTKWTAART